MKKNLVGIFQIFYGSTIIVGIIYLIIGLFFLNISIESRNLLIAGVDILIGVLLIFISYIFYQKEMEKLSKDIYPIIFPEEENSPNVIPNSSIGSGSD